MNPIIAYCIWSDRDNCFMPQTKGGVPKIYTREQDAKILVTSLNNQHDRCLHYSTLWPDRYKNFDLRPLQLRIIKVKIELIE